MTDQPNRCSSCGASRFVQVGRVELKLQMSDSRSPWSSKDFTARGDRDTQFHGSLVVCTACGLTAFFMEDPVGWAQHAAASGATVTER